MRNLTAALSCMMSVGFAVLSTASCGGTPDSSSDSTGSTESAYHGGGGGGGDYASIARGRELFFRAKFGGNGRTCGTCHSEDTGTITPDLLRDLYRHDRHNPIFRPIDSDDGVGNSYTRLLKNATIRITLDLPPHMRLHDNPSQRSITVNRSTPTMFNAALFSAIMWDGRESNLETQALDAVHAHVQERFEPTPRDLKDIAAFEDTLFTNDSLRRYAHGGPPPTLPDGRTDSEKRGRAFFNEDGACGSCHGGPMMDSNTPFSLFNTPGSHFSTVFAGYEGGLGFDQPADSPNPVLVYDMDCKPDDPSFCDIAQAVGATLVGDDLTGVATYGMPDPGNAIPTQDNGNFLFFKIPTLWGVSKTAPYFHDNSAMTLEDVMQHYDKFLSTFTGVGLTAQDQQDIIAYLKLL